MTPRQRFLNALARRQVDRVPVANPTSVVTVELQEKLGVFLPEANNDARAMARLALGGHTVCGYDVAMPLFGAGTQEAAALGVPVRWGERDSLPAIAGHIWDHPDDIRIPGDFLEKPSTASALEAIRIIRQEVGAEVGIVGKVFGPWSLGYHTFGLQTFLKNTIKDAQWVKEVMRRLKEITLIFAEAQIEAGADALTVADHITADLIRPEAYPRFLLDIHRELSRRIPVPLIFHCCGRTIDRIEHFNRNGMASYHFESANDAFEMKDKATMVLAGNVNNIKTLMTGTVEDVRQEVFRALDAGVEIIAPECAVPVTAKLDNITAVREAVDDYHMGHQR